jgi:hypothetical protein
MDGFAASDALYHLNARNLGITKDQYIIEMDKLRALMTIDAEEMAQRDLGYNLLLMMVRVYPLFDSNVQRFSYTAEGMSIRVLLSLYLTPYTLHLTSYTLYLIPYILHLTPYTSHLTPHTSHLTPHTLHLTPYTLHLTPYILYLIPYIFHLTPYAIHLKCRTCSEETSPQASWPANTAVAKCHPPRLMTMPHPLFPPYTATRHS